MLVVVPVRWFCARTTRLFSYGNPVAVRASLLLLLPPVTPSLSMLVRGCCCCCCLGYPVRRIDTIPWSCLVTLVAVRVLRCCSNVVVTVRTRVAAAVVAAAATAAATTTIAAHRSIELIRFDQLSYGNPRCYKTRQRWRRRREKKQKGGGKWDWCRTFRP